MSDDETERLFEKFRGPIADLVGGIQKKLPSA